MIVIKDCQSCFTIANCIVKFSCNKLVGIAQLLIHDQMID